MDGEALKGQVTPLRIGINALFLIPGGVGGTEIYLRFLLDALGRIDGANEYEVFLNRETDSSLVPTNRAFHVVRCPVSARFRPARILFEQFRLPRLLARYRVDVLLNPGFTGPLSTRVPQVTVFHDLQHKRHPEFFRRLDLPFWNLLLAGSVRCSDRLIAVSESTARDLADCFPQSAGKISTVLHGVDPEFFSIGKRRRENGGPIHSGRPFILIVSTLHPHKNLERALNAFRLFRQARPEYQLVVAGLRGFAAEALDEHRSRLDLSEDVVFTGWIPRCDLYELFLGAAAYLAPSLFEGFGLPLVEALAAGLPSACSSIAPFHETAAGVAHFFDPLSTESMRDALAIITADESFRSRACAAGPEAARRFDWNRCAEATLRELVAAAQLSRPDSENSPTIRKPLAPTKTVPPVSSHRREGGREAIPTR